MIIRKYMFTHTAVACYLMHTDKVDTYCRTADEKAMLYMKVINGRGGFDKRPSSFRGRRKWEWETFYGEETTRFWESTGRRALVEMLKQGQEAKEAVKKQLDVIDLYVQDELELQLVDKDGRKVKKKKDGTVIPI